MKLADVPQVSSQQSLGNGLPSLRVDDAVPVRKLSPHEPVSIEAAINQMYFFNRQNLFGSGRT